MKKKLLCVAMLAALGLAGSAWGIQTQTTTMPVTAYVGGTCTVNATPLDFGNLEVSGSNVSQTNAQATVTVNCSSGLPFSIGLDDGMYYSGTRRMMGPGGQYLLYDIYTPIGDYGTRWDLINVESGSGTGTPQNFMAFGQVPSQAVSIMGQYSDTVTVQVNF